MTARRWLSSLLIAALITALAPGTGWAAGNGSTKEKEQTTGRLRAAVAHAAADAAAMPATQLRARPSAAGVRRQSAGGGHTMMVVSLLSTVVGVGATVYMVKQMQKNTKTN